VRTFENPVDSLLELTWSPEDRMVTQTDARVESMDRYGGDRQVVAEGIDVLLPPLHDGEPWLGYRDDAYALYWFDPHGRFAPRQLATIRNWTWLIVHGHTLFVHRTDHRGVARVTLEGNGDDVRTEVLVTDVLYTSSMRRTSQLMSIAALRDDGSLVALDLPTTTTEVVREGVRVFATTPDLRWIAWAPGDPARASGSLPREVWLLDRERGEEQPIAFDDTTGIAVQIHAEHLVAWSENGHQSWTTRFIWLPGGLEIDLEGVWHQFGSFPRASRRSSRWSRPCNPASHTTGSVCSSSRPEL
jgi:hypothetical protein